MSTTSDLRVALMYSTAAASGAAGGSSVLLRLKTSSFMDRGADLSFLSCFPNECEILFPPLTYLKPHGRPRHIAIEGGGRLLVLDVVPHFGSS